MLTINASVKPFRCKYCLEKNLVLTILKKGLSIECVNPSCKINIPYNLLELEEYKFKIKSLNIYNYSLFKKDVSKNINAAISLWNDNNYLPFIDFCLPEKK